MGRTKNWNTDLRTPQRQSPCIPCFLSLTSVHATVLVKGPDKLQMWETASSPKKMQPLCLCGVPASFKMLSKCYISLKPFMSCQSVWVCNLTVEIGTYFLKIKLSTLPINLKRTFNHFYEISIRSFTYLENDIIYLFICWFIYLIINNLHLVVH